MGRKRHGFRKLKTNNPIRKKGGGKGNEAGKDGDEGEMMWRAAEEYWHHWPQVASEATLHRMTCRCWAYKGFLTFLHDEVSQDQHQLLNIGHFKAAPDYRDQSPHHHLKMTTQGSRETKRPAHVIPQGAAERGQKLVSAPWPRVVTALSLSLGPEGGFHLILFYKHEKRQKKEVGRGLWCGREKLRAVFVLIAGRAVITTKGQR